MKRTLRCFLAIVFLAPSANLLAQNSVGIGTETPNPRAVLELIATTNNQGFLAPRLTTSQRVSFGASLSATDNGMLVFDSGEGQFYVWASLQWRLVGATEYLAGAGIAINNKQITNTGDVDATDDVTVTSVAAGDVAGVFGELVVSGIGGRPIDTDSEPLVGYTLVWDGTQWKLQLPVASQQSVQPTADLLATTTQSALEELQNELLAIVDTDDQSAAEVVYSDNQSVGQTTVQGAIDYLLTTGDGDNDPANELQSLSISGNSVAIDGGTGFDLAPTTPTAGQVLKWSGTAWDVASDEGITSETDPAWTADKATLGTSGTINDGQNLVDWTQLKNVPAEIADGTDDAGGDMQTAVYDTDLDGTVDNAALVNGLSVETAVPAAAVFTDSQSATEVAYTDNQSVGATNVQGALDYLLTTGDGDNDPANELQNVSISGNTVAIDGGTGFDLAPTTPAAGQVLKWNGTSWDVASDDGIITETDPAWAADKATLGTSGTINDGQNLVDWTQLKNVPAEIADGTDDAGGDMQTAVYDTDLDNMVDNAALVNGLSVETAVPTAAVFTDSQSATEVAYTDNQSVGATNVQGALDYLLTTGDGDNDPANELQNVSINGNTVAIDGGTGFDLAPTTPTAGQVLKWNGTGWDAASDEAGLSTVSSTDIADGTIEDTDINAAAAIAGSKINPDFGAQTLTTTGNLIIGGSADFAGGLNLSGGGLTVGSVFSVEETTGDIQINDDFHLFHFEDGVTIEGELIAENLHADGNLLRYTKAAPASFIFQSAGQIQLIVGSSQAAGTDAIAAAAFKTALSLSNEGDAEFRGAVEIGELQGTATQGMLRYQSGIFEGYDGVTWTPLSGISFPYNETINDGNASPFYIENQGTGGVAEFNLNNTGAFGNALTVNNNSNETFSRALRVSHSGLGAGLEVEVMNVNNAEPALLAKTTGVASAGVFEIDNSANTVPALEGNIVAGGGVAVQGVTTGEGAAGRFTVENVSNGSIAFIAESNGTNSTAYFNHSNAASTTAAVEINQAGSGAALSIQSQLGTSAIGDESFFAGNVGVKTFNPGVSLDVNGTDAVRIAQGTTAQRPATPAQGMIRYNSSLSQYEGYSGSTWNNLGSRWSASGSDIWYTTGNVGIGIANPSETLDVNGSVQVAGTGDYKYANAKTRVLSVSNKSFTVEGNQALATSGGATGKYVSSGTQGTIASLFTGIELPDGAVVTQLNVNFIDNDATYDISAQLARGEHTSTGAIAMATIASTGQNASVQSLSTSSIAAPAIDNSLYYYYLVFQTRQSNADMSLLSFTVTYTVNQAD